MILIEFGIWDASVVGANYKDFVKFLFYSNESIWRIMEAKGQGKATHRQASIIVDLKGLNFRQVTTIDGKQNRFTYISYFGYENPVNETTFFCCT